MKKNYIPAVNDRLYDEDRDIHLCIRKVFPGSKIAFAEVTTRVFDPVRMVDGVLVSLEYFTFTQLRKMVGGEA